MRPAWQRTPYSLIRNWFKFKTSPCWLLTDEKEARGVSVTSACRHTTHASTNTLTSRSANIFNFRRHVTPGVIDILQNLCMTLLTVSTLPPHWHPLPPVSACQWHDTTTWYLVGSRNLSFPEVNVIKWITSAAHSDKLWYGITVSGASAHQCNEEEAQWASVLMGMTASVGACLGHRGGLGIRKKENYLFSAENRTTNPRSANHYTD